jgi:hypothetical protein
VTRFARIGRIVLVVVAAAPAGGLAAPPGSLQVRGQPGACPSAEQVTANLAGLLRRTRVTVGDRAKGPQVLVEDRGPSFRVHVDGGARDVEDHARDCAERARVAAVLIALTLDPPPVLAVPKPAPAPRPPGPAPFRFDAAAAALVAIAPGADAGTLSGGAAVRFALGGARFGASLGVGAGSPARLSLAPGTAEILRVPFDLGGYASIGAGRFEAVGEVGLLVAVERIVARDVEQPQRFTRPEVGLRAGASCRYWGTSRFAPFVGLAAQVVPSPHELVITPRGVVATLPRVWLELVAGVAVRSP